MLFRSQSNTSVLTVTAQDTYTWDLTGNTYTQSTSDTLILTNAAGCDSSIILNLTIETSSLNNLIESKYNLRPNPADKFLIIDFNTTGLDHTIEIYDLYGKVVKVFKVMANSTIVNIENLSPGIYSVFIDKRINVGRFVKQ